MHRASELHELIYELFQQSTLIFYLCFQNDTLQNNNGIGSSEQFVDGNGTLFDSSSTDVFMGMDGASDLLLGFSIYTEPIRSEIIEHAFSAMNELSKIGVAGQPLWQPQTNNNGCEILNYAEYSKQFNEVDSSLKEIVKLIEVGESQNLPSFDTHQTEVPESSVTLPTVAPGTEGSRHVAFINMSPMCIVGLLMDVVSYLFIFFHPFPSSCM